FITQIFVGGDWPYLFPSASIYFPVAPALYKSYLQLGLYNIPLAGIDTYYQITSHFFNPLFGWAVTEKIFWFFPFLLIAIFSSYTLTKSWIGVFIYCANSYILMVVGGGQLGIAIAYAIMPLALWLLLQFNEYKFEARNPKFETNINVQNIP